MPRQRAVSNASTNSSIGGRDQELGSMYDYLAKIILLGPSGTGKSCVLHRFIKNEWRVLSSQTIGVEFASKIVKVGSGSQRKRIKLQLWDTAGTERFRSVSRSYYRGAAGALLIYDISSRASFRALPTFLNDARALTSPDLTMILVGNKTDLDEEYEANGRTDILDTPIVPSSMDGGASIAPSRSRGSTTSSKLGGGFGSTQTATVAPEGREVLADEASRWASAQRIPVTMEVSAFSGENVDEVFTRLARMILTKIELGQINPDDPSSGIQYGDSGWGAHAADGASIKSGITIEDSSCARRRRGGRQRNAGWTSGLREWEEVFRLDRRRRRSGCC